MAKLSTLDLFGGTAFDAEKQFLFLQSHRFGLTSSGLCTPHYTFDKYYGLEEYVKFQTTIGCISKPQANAFITSEAVFDGALQSAGWTTVERNLTKQRADGAKKYRQLDNNANNRSYWCISSDEPQAPALPLLSALNRSLGVFSKQCLREYGLRHAGGFLPSLLHDRQGAFTGMPAHEIPSLMAGLVSFNTLEL